VGRIWKETVSAFGWRAEENQEQTQSPYLVPFPQSAIKAQSLTRTNSSSSMDNELEGIRKETVVAWYREFE
jgi:hypothetical protein